VDFNYSEKTLELRARVQGFTDDHIVPRLGAWNEEIRAGKFPVSFMEDLKNLARSEGLWNLFLPSLGEGEPGSGLTNLEYAPVAEVMGRIPWSSEVFNCSAPDTGNMEPQPPAQWRDPFGVRHDRARRGLLGRHQYPDLDPARR
jgi:acyl-CoA dehydrogenase